MPVPGFASQPFCLLYIFCWDESQVEMSLAYLIMGKGGVESTKTLRAGKIIRWFVQSILSDVQST